MLWRCPACNRQTEEPVCSRCQTPMEAGEPSDATGLIKETCGSVLYLIAVICFTASIILSMVISWIPNKNAITFNTDEIKTAISNFEEDSGLQFNPRERKAILNLADEANKNETINVDTVVNSDNGSFPLLSILACIGLWLLLAQGYNAHASLQKAGPILLKIATIIGEVVAIILTVCAVMLGVGLWLGRPELVATLNDQDGDALAESLRVLLSSDVIMWGLLILCGLLVVAGILYTLFFIFATRTVNGILHTAETGHFGKNASALVAVMLGLSALGLLAGGISSLLVGSWGGGIAALLKGAAFLLFSIILFIYRHRAHELSWEQPAFTGETAAGMPDIPADIKASELMNERQAMPIPVVPITPATPVKSNPQQPRRTLNEPFAEDSLEPKPMTANGCCPKCGTPIPDDTFFCLHCGYKFK